MCQIHNYGQTLSVALTVGRPIGFKVIVRRGTAAPESLHRIKMLFWVKTHLIKYLFVYLHDKVLRNLLDEIIDRAVGRDVPPAVEQIWKFWHNKPHNYPIYLIIINYIG